MSLDRNNLTLLQTLPERLPNLRVLQMAKCLSILFYLHTLKSNSFMHIILNDSNVAFYQRDIFEEAPTLKIPHIFEEGPTLKIPHIFEGAPML